MYMGNPVHVWVAHTHTGNFHDPYAYGLPVHVQAAHTSVSWEIIGLPICIFVPVRIWVSCPYVYMTYVYRYSYSYRQVNTEVQLQSVVKISYPI